MPHFNGLAGPAGHHPATEPGTLCVMTSSKRMSALAVLVAIVCCCPEANAQRNFSQQNAAQFGWHSNYARGLEEARADNKPVMLVFRCVP
jgi:hypothetical protein